MSCARSAKGSVKLRELPCEGPVKGRVFLLTKPFQVLSEGQKVERSYNTRRFVAC